MVTQKAISAKIDLKLLEELDKEVSLGWKKRNALINDAIKVYLSLQDTRREFKCLGDPDAKVEVAGRWLRRYFPESIPWIPE